HRGEFVLDREGADNGKVSQRITQKPGDPCTVGISQSSKFVKAGESIRCRLSLRSSGLTRPVEVSLWGHGKTYASAELRPDDHWRRFEAILTPTQTDDNATFTISFRGPGTLWIDQVSLMPDDNIFGWRRDVAVALKAMKPGIIRFGGSTTEGFDWKDTIGDPARRVPFTTVWGGLEPGNAGLEEFVKLCQWVGAEPLICVRFTGKTPHDAADQVEYFNGPPDTPMGKLRAAGGRPEPYGVRYWQIGNELGDEAYQKGIAQFCRAMKAVDPTIKLLAAFPSPGLLENAGGLVDYICPHHYDCANLKATEDDIDRCRRMIARSAPGREIRLGVTEWNTTAGDWGLTRAMLWTLDNALKCSRYHNLIHRRCDLVEIANRSNLTDSFCSGVIQTNAHSLYLTPTYYAQQLYAMKAGKRPLRIIDPDNRSSDAGLDMSATESEDERRVTLFVVNDSREPKKRTLLLAPLGELAADAALWTLGDTLHASERDIANSWREPDRIRPVEGKATVAEGQLVYQFPLLSLTVIQLSRSK
ncbi:MAG TPA: alpha-L-arabinofuranosidase C-terminal domain-containing protein, partial [Isosphaeraceae bacterium]|nr:alpha-L-arabinofuranosidase C-terminal domain-containing protein [Isosphaeraceae bacterium]